MTTDLPAFDVEGPVTAEIFVVARVGSGIVLTGPDGPQAWMIEAVDAGDPMSLVNAIVRRHLPEVDLVHSTSWRYEPGRVVLSFVVVVPERAVADLPRLPVARAALARGGATASPEAIPSAAVLDHGLRHLAWLAKDDPVVADTLDDEWHALLTGYVPAPFAHLESNQ